MLRFLQEREQERANKAAHDAALKQAQDLLTEAGRKG